MLNLSFIISTRNRLPFLKITLGKLISELQQDEEIVIVDGNSTDGTREYLQKLFDEGKIHLFISEPDHSQAHGWNKAMLMANGIVLKKIMDDDVYDYDAIRKCRDYMMQHPEMDVCISNCLTGNLASPDKAEPATRLPWYKKWRDGKVTAFTFSDVYMLVRRSSLAYIGLYDTQFTMLDWEYSLRMTHLQVKIAYYTGCMALAVHTQGNVTSSLTKKQAKLEEAIGRAKYGYPGDRSEISLYSEFKIAIGNFIARFNPTTTATFKTGTVIPGENELTELYREFYKTLSERNSCESHEFIY